MSNDTAAYVNVGEEYNRDTNYIEDRILDDPDARWPVEPGRYRLIAARACPWANRTVIVRRLLGLEDVISLGMPGPTHDQRSWTFDLDPGGVDPVLGIERLQQAFFTRFPDYPRGITVPAIVDIPTGAVVTNDFPQITADFATQWRSYHREGAPDLWPEESRDEMESLMKLIYTEINNGVYRRGFAGSQEAYDKAFDRLFTALDTIEERLATRRFLMGESITEADVRLFTTLARFDPVYYGHFKTNRTAARSAICGGTPATSIRRPGSATRSTSRRSNSTTTSSTRTSIPPASFPTDRISPAGSPRMVVRSSVAVRSATARRRDPSPPARRFPSSTPPPPG